MTTPQHPKGFKWSRFARLVFATYGDSCIVCGHGGARTVDHLESLTEHPELTWVLSNCRPIHAKPYNPCPTCHMGCNGIKGGYSLERARRIWAERTGQKPAKPEPPPEAAGREW